LTEKEHAITKRKLQTDLGSLCTWKSKIKYWLWTRDQELKVAVEKTEFNLI
jgi:hypothetical protein